MSVSASREHRPPFWVQVGAGATGDRLTAVAVIVITAVALGIRLSQLRQGLYGDELTTYHEVVGHSLTTVLNSVSTAGENSPPLFFILAWLSSKLGDPTVWIRVPSLILGAATLPLIFVLGRDTAGRTVGLVGAAIVAVSPFSTYYGIEARPYATMAFFVTLSLLMLVRAVRTGSWWYWGEYALASAAAAYSHYTSIFVLVTAFIWALVRSRHELHKPLIAACVVALLYVPWLSHIQGALLFVISFLHPLNVHNVVVDLVRPIAGHPEASLATIPTAAGLVILGAAAVLGMLGLVRSSGRGIVKVSGLPSERALLVAAAIATPVGLLLYSVLKTDIWLPRSLYASVPSAALVFAMLLAALPRRVMALGIVAVFVVLVFGTIRTYRSDVARPPYRAIAAHLDAVARPRDPIISYPSLVGEGVRPYYRRGHTLLTASSGVWRLVPPGARAYVLIYDAGGYGLYSTAPHPAGFRMVARIHYVGLKPTDLYAYVRR